MEATVKEPELAERPYRSFYQRHERLILGGASALAALAAWQALWSSGRISPLFFTGPSSIVKRFTEEWTNGRLKSDMVYSGTNFAIGVGLAIAAGDPITIADTATGLNTLTGYVTSYNAQNGALIVQIGFTYQFEIRKPPPHWQPGIGYVAFYDFGTAPGTPILSASLANGEITVIDLGTLQVRIPESIFRKLHGGTYAVCMTMTDSYDTRQVFLGALPVLHGGVTN